MKIYTKKGDNGETDLYDLQSQRKIRISKDFPRLEAIGIFDELNSCLGLAASFGKKNRKIIQNIQGDIFAINAILAGRNLQFPLAKTLVLEKIIDNLEVKLPALNNFILPTGTKAASILHLARSICRRGERDLIRLAKKEKIAPAVLQYINRLSDLLFLLARKENFLAKYKDLIWKNKVSF